MGYYTGSGTTTIGGESIAPLTSISFRDVNGNLAYYFVEQKTRRTVTRKAGLPLTDHAISGGLVAQGVKSFEATSNVSELILEYFWWSTGSGGSYQNWVIPSAKGNKTDVRYAQIDGSNLYELVSEQTQLWERHKLNNTNYTNWAGG